MQFEFNINYKNINFIINFFISNTIGWIYVINQKINTFQSFLICVKSLKVTLFAK